MSAYLTSAALSVGAVLRDALHRQAAEADGIVQGFGVVQPVEVPQPLRVRCIDNAGASLLVLGAEYVVLSEDARYYYLGTGADGWSKDRFEPVPVQPAEVLLTKWPRVTKGRARGEAVSAHLAAAANHMARRWERASQHGPEWAKFCADLQAGAAASRCMAECLDALMDGDVALFRATVEQFVNDAVTSGAVTLPVRA